MKGYTMKIKFTPNRKTGYVILALEIIVLLAICAWIVF